MPGCIFGVLCEERELINGRITSHAESWQSSEEARARKTLEEIHMEGAL